MADTALIQDRYRLLDLIGRGGMGEVWRAHDEALGRQVAVKRLKPLGAQGDRSFMRVLRERFRREARVAAGLQHRGVTVVHDFGEHEGVLYLVMELVDGRNLSQLLEENHHHPLPVPEILAIADQVAAALAYTHDQGIVHRDLKPANVMRTADGTVKICDFGIARLGHDIGFTSKLTGNGIAMGTPHYMSPEQIAGVAVDHRSDLYSLGCVLYEIATGVPPFDNGDAWSVLIGHRDTPPEPPRRHRAELPEPLEEAILTLLAKEPEGRPEDAAALGRLLGAAVPHPGTGPGPFAGSVRPGGHRPASHGAPSGLPAWTRGMVTGAKAGASGALRTATPPGHLAALTGAWTGPTQPPPVLAPGALPGGVAPEGVPSAVPTPAGEGTPAPEALAVLARRHNAGLSLSRLGRWDEAHAVHSAVAAEREQLLGPDHPDTLAARYETGVGLGRLGRSAEALDLYHDLVAARTRAQGADDPETLRARHGLGVNLGRLGRWEEALAQAREVCALRESVLGPDHPDTLISRREIAVGLGWLGRWTDALEVYRQVAGARERVLGAAHPEALGSRNDEAHCLEQLGRSAEAADLYGHVASLRDRTAS